MFLSSVELFGSLGSFGAHTQGCTQAHTLSTPYRAELMQEEMKYHYLRGKHTSVRAHTNRSRACAYTPLASSPRRAPDCSRILSRHQRANLFIFTPITCCCFPWPLCSCSSGALKQRMHVFLCAFVYFCCLVCV